MGNNKKQTVDTKKKTKKKKGRPSLIELEKRRLQTQNPNPNRRSTRRNPNPNSDEEIELEEEEEEEDLRKQKKVKLVGKIPNGSGINDESGSDSDGSKKKKRKIDISFEETARQNSSTKGTEENLEGNPSDSGPTTPLPDKKLLVFILDRLQKKDTYAVFSEPVDPEELPDYHEIIKDPMDFGTVRKKLDSGAYENLEQFESDVFLISSNAMQYNANDTIYFRQARSIQELAKKDFENLRHESDDNETEPKVARRGRPPIKNVMKRIGRPPIDRTGSEFSSDATLANARDGSHTISNSTRGDVLRRGSSIDKPNITNSSRGIEEYTGSPLKGIPVKNWKRFSEIDENRRNTYNQPAQPMFHQEPSILHAFDGERKVLIPVGLYMPHTYARSLARFAANLGPIGWEIASKRIERVLPPGTKFGPGWIGENESLLQSKLKQKTSETLETTSNSSVGSVKREGETEKLHFCSNSKINGFKRGYGLNMSSQEEKAATHGSSSSNNYDVEEKRGSEVRLRGPPMNSKMCSDPPDLNVDFSGDSQQQQPELALQL